MVTVFHSKVWGYNLQGASKNEGGCDPACLHNHIIYSIKSHTIFVTSQTTYLKEFLFNIPTYQSLKAHPRSEIIKSSFTISSLHITTQVRVKSQQKSVAFYLSC